MAAQVPSLAQQPAHVPARQAGSRGRSSTSGSTESSTASSASDSSQSRAAGRNAAPGQRRLRPSPSPSFMHAPDQHRHHSSNRPPSRPGHSRDNGLSRCDALLCVCLQRITQHHACIDVMLAAAAAASRANAAGCLTKLHVFTAWQRLGAEPWAEPISFCSAQCSPGVPAAAVAGTSAADRRGLPTRPPGCGSDMGTTRGTAAAGASRADIVPALKGRMASERGHLTGAGWARGGPQETCAAQGGSKGGVAAQVKADMPAAAAQVCLRLLPLLQRLRVLSSGPGCLETLLCHHRLQCHCRLRGWLLHAAGATEQFAAPDRSLLMQRFCNCRL